jgi:iron complex outermembrane receptor protein
MKKLQRRHKGLLPGRPTLLRLRLSALAAACATIFAADLTSAQNNDGEAIEEIMITGSRIRATGFSTPTPVTAVSSEELEFMAPGNLIESVTQLPIFFNNTTQDTPGSFFRSPGSGSLNIRGLNTNRTLTLLNGRRMTPSNRIGSVDINSFPEALISRVEVVTGGASAAYGTDAVAGVANFILDTGFDGLKTHIQAGNSSSNSRNTWEVGATYGTDIGERGHLILSAEAYAQDGVNGFTNQSWYKGFGQVRDSTPGSRLDLVVPNVVSTQGSQNGIISSPGSALNGWEFQPDGTAGPFQFGSPVGARAHSITNGGSGTTNGTERNTLSPEAERENFFAYYDFDLNDSTNLYAQLSIGQNTSLHNNLGGVFTGASNGLTVFSGNPFLPASVQQIMDDEGLASFSFQRFGSAADLSAGAQQETENSNTALTLGFEKDIITNGMFDGWQVRGYVQAGRAEHRGAHKNGIRIDRLPAAVDAVLDGNGNTVCYAALQDPANWSDCVPVNLFGAGNASSAAREYLTGLDAGTQVSSPVFYTDSGFSKGRTISYTSGVDKITQTDYDQDIIDFSIDGPIAEGWAGPIMAAFGAHYREESIDQIALDHTNPSGNLSSRPAAHDPSIVRGIGTGMSGRTTAIQFASVPNLNGGYRVKEAFAEFIIPLVADKPGFDSLTASLAYRWADYSGSGGIEAWKAGLDWQINDDLRVRSTVSRDVRAASLAERLDRTGGITNIEDRAFGAGTRFDTSLAAGGNPNLNPEEADTITAGVVFQPSFLPGFQASVDWYEIEINGAVGQLGIQAIVDECFDSPASASCNLVHRDPISNVIVLVENVFVNINAAKASGIDFELAYRTDFGPGNLGWRFLGTQLEENSITNFGAPKVDFAGDVGVSEFPDFKFTTNLTYTQGPYSGFLQARYIGDGLYNTRDIEGVTISDNSVDDVLYIDARVSYGRDSSNWQVFASVTNLFDEEPPVVPGFSSFTGQASQANAAIHDILGRRFTIGFNYNL